jgi:hypothetical protein
LTDDLNLGRLLGRREAFSAMAGRCSAADAEQLRIIRDTKAYLNHAKDWKTFCTTFLHISDDTANRLIGLLERFGSAYFKISQLTRISPSAYRAIAPSIRGEAIHHNGEVIPLTVENAERVAAAVAELREAAAPLLLPPSDAPALPPALPPAPEPAPMEIINALEKECYDMCRRVEAVIALRLEYREQLRAVVCGVRDRFNYLELTL